MPIELRDYQEKSVAEIREALRRSRRVLFVSPTGSGKTEMFMWLGQETVARSKRVTIVAHRDEIATHVSERLREAGIEHGMIAQGYPESQALVQVAMVMTLARRLERYPPPDMVIVDEAHHSSAESWQRVLRAYSDALRLGVTATPLRLDGKPMREHYLEMVLGLTVSELTGLGWLSPAVTFAPKVLPDLTGLRTIAGDYDIDELERRMITAKLIGDAVEHYQRFSPQLPGLAYCCSIPHAEALCAAFRAKHYVVDHVDHHTSPAARRAAIAGLKAGKIHLLTNVGLFTEGVDVPALGLVLLLRPTMSLSLYLQMVGRALRTTPGKVRALILDHASNCQRHGLYDFPHQWSLDGRPKTGGPETAPLRRCFRCGAMIPLASRVCPECGFVLQVTTPERELIPEVAPGQLEPMDDDRELLTATKGGKMPYRKLLEWIRAPSDVAERWRRAERARRINKYHRGWCRYVVSGT